MRRGTSDKKFVLESIGRMPGTATIGQILERISFLAAIRAGEGSLNRGKHVNQKMVEKKLADWICDRKRNATRTIGAEPAKNPDPMEVRRFRGRL